MPTIYLIEGPVGAGKSTYAMQLSKQQAAPWLNLDDWMSTLFSPDRPQLGRVEWYMERKSRCIDQIWKVAQAILTSGSNVILELGLIRRSDRAPFFAWVEDTDYALSAHVVDAAEQTRRERVHLRNLRKDETYAMDVPDAFFTMANNMWEPIEINESERLNLSYISTEGK